MKNFLNNLPLDVSKLLQDFVQKSSDVFWIRSADYKVHIYLSPSYHTIWGRTAEEVYQYPDSWLATLHAEDRPLIIQKIRIRQKNVSSPHHLTEEYRIMRPDNEIRWIRDNSFALFDKNKKHVGYAGVAQDITQEKNILNLKDKIEDANRMKSEFLANISHDLRTPLANIINVAELLEHRFSDGQEKELIDLLTHSSRSLLEFNEEILAFTKLESGKLPLRFEAFDFRQLIEDVVNSLAAQARHKTVNLIIDYHDVIARHFIGDTFRVRRILLNLISNAIKFTEYGHILVAVDEINQSAQHIEIQLAIEDTGLGIHKDKIDTIFDRFSNVEGSYQGRYIGSGLGLTIIKQLIAEMGGSISVNSQMGKGSTFYCTLLFEQQTIHQKQSLWQRHYQDVRLLVLDDHQAHGENTVKQLGTPQVKLAHSNAAKEILLQAQERQKPFEIVIIDDKIAECTAFEFARWIHCHLVHHEPMILFSLQSAQAPLLNKTRSLGFDYILKPLQPTEVSQKVASCWQKWLAKKMKPSDQIKNFGAQVLLVEDEPTNQKIVSILLRDELGCQVTLASTGKQAIELFKLHDFDLILMDIGLPDHNGLDVTRQLRTLDDESRPTPIYGLTAHVTDDAEADCIAAGMQGRITKPASLATLEKLVSECITTATVGLEPA